MIPRRSPTAAALLLCLSCLACGCDRTGSAPHASSPAVADEVQFLGQAPGGFPLSFAASFTGSERCVGCHPTHGDEQKTHRMALAGQRLTAASRTQWFSAERLARPVTWPPQAIGGAPAYRVRGDAVTLESPPGAGEPSAAPVLAVLGSGHHGVTPIAAEAGRRIRELRLSYFPAHEGWRMTPGSVDDPDPLGTPNSPERSLWCLGCHATALRWRDERLEAEGTVFGIHCERCHGPGSAHIAAVEAGEADLAIFNPQRLRADDQVRFCGECHRRPGDVDPGDALRAEPSLARHAGASLMLSACFRRSPPEATITCTDCHDPHQNASSRSRTSHSRACLRCHERPEERHGRSSVPAAREVTATSDCIPCHLPLEERGMVGLAFTDHWIRVPGRPPPLSSPARGEYIQALERGYREAISSPIRGAEGKATFHVRLGDLLCADGRCEDGVLAFREALALRPIYSVRVSIAERFLRAKLPQEAVRTLEAAIADEPQFNRAYRSLAETYLKLDQPEMAAAVLERWRQRLPSDALISETASQIARHRAARPGGR